MDKNIKASPKDKKLTSLSKPKYTTREILELEARRRRELKSAQQAADADVQAVEASPENIKNRLSEPVTEEKVPLPDGKVVAQFFREAPVSPKEKEISSLIEKQWNQALDVVTQDLKVPEENAASLEGKVKRFTDDVPLSKLGQAEVLSRAQVSQEIARTDWMGLSVALLAGAMFFVMFSHLFSIGFDQRELTQGPFALMITLSIVWLNRRHLEERREWFWGAVSIISGGLGIFALGFLQGSLYLALLGFMFTSFGVFLWRYTEESACRLIFPLAYLVFMFSPPDLWARAFVPVLNSLSVHGAYFLLASFHIPAPVQGLVLNFDSYRYSIDGDLTAFRSLAAFSGLAALLAYFQRTALIGKVIILVSVVPIILLADITRVALIGWVTEDLGIENGQAFLNDYSVLTVFVLTTIGLFLVSLAVRGEEEQTN